MATKKNQSKAGSSKSESESTIKKQIRLMIASNAGGSGKTTLAVHLAYGLAKRGHSVCIVELDHNGSLSTLAGLEPAEAKEDSVAYLFEPGFQGDYPFVPLWPDKVSDAVAIRGGQPLENIGQTIYMADRKSMILADVLEDHPIKKEVVIFDTPASLESVGPLALSASTHLIVPIKPEYKDVGSFADLLTWFYGKCDSLRLRPKPELLGFVPSRVSLAKAPHRNILGVDERGRPSKIVPIEETLPYQIEKMQEHYFPLIRESNFYLHASGFGLPIQLYRPGTDFGNDFDPVIDHIVKILKAIK